MSEQITTIEDVKVICVCDSANGIYIPSIFLENYENTLVDSSFNPIEDEELKESIEFVKNRDNIDKDGYWDEWQYLTEELHLVSTLDNETVFFLHIGDGDLFAVEYNKYNLLSDEEQEELLG